MLNDHIIELEGCIESIEQRITALIKVYDELRFRERPDCNYELAAWNAAAAGVRGALDCEYAELIRHQTKLTGIRLKMQQEIASCV